MRSVTCADVERGRAAGAQVVEVLGAEEFAWAHLRGALHLPLRHLDDRARAVLDVRRPVVVYCNDFL